MERNEGFFHLLSDRVGFFEIRIGGMETFSKKKTGWGVFFRNDRTETF